MAGYLAEAGQLQGSALCLPGAVLAERVGGIWSRLRAVLEDGQTGPPAGRTPGRGWTAPGRCAAALWAALAA